MRYYLNTPAYLVLTMIPFLLSSCGNGDRPSKSEALAQIKTCVERFGWLSVDDLSYNNGFTTASKEEYEFEAKISVHALKDYNGYDRLFAADQRNNIKIGESRSGYIKVWFGKSDKGWFITGDGNYACGTADRPGYAFTPYDTPATSP